MISKNKGEKSKNLFWEKENVWNNSSQKEKEQIMDFCEQYKDFLTKSKTERLCCENIIFDLQKNWFSDIGSFEKLKKWDKFYKNFKWKTVLAGIVWEENQELRLIWSHTDSPRLDLKPNPLYEEGNLWLLQSHYYGGIKKYHRVNTPLSIIWVVCTKKWKKVQVQIGEDEKDPKFVVPDLLPHLASKQMEKKASEVISWEELNIIFWHIPVEDENIKEKIKYALLEKLDKEYGMCEEDFSFAELELVPSGKSFDVGIDRWLVWSYWHDDRVCVYTSLKALLNSKNVSKTCIWFFVDREEVGSVGDTWAESFVLLNFIKEYIRLTGTEKKAYEIFENSLSVSADVTSWMDPTYKDKVDISNAYYLWCGIALEKYVWAKGKAMTNEAHCEYMNYLRSICQKNSIIWQTWEHWKIDEGGGWTIAMFMSRYGMDCVDLGIPVLGMHSPCEIVSKADVYSLYRFYKAFFEDDSKLDW